MANADSDDASKAVTPDESQLAECLLTQGFVLVPARFSSVGQAWAMALSVATLARDLAYRPGECLEVVGEFNLPPEGSEQRDFQALHVDFGIPRLCADTVDVALYTALYVDVAREGSGTSTRLAPLHRVLQQRPWPSPSIVTERLCDATADGPGVEGMLARIIECVDQTQDLPAQGNGFLCGTEFDTLDQENQYFQRHGIQLDEAEESVVLTGGQLLLFDNLAIAHGRHGRRTARELHQLCLGVKAVDRPSQAGFVEALAARFGVQAASGVGG